MQASAEPIKRPRGRPRKNPLPVETDILPVPQWPEIEHEHTFMQLAAWTHVGEEKVIVTARVSPRANQQVLDNVYPWLDEQVKAKAEHLKHG